MKQVSLILSIVSLCVAITFGVLFLTSNGKGAHKAAVAAAESQMEATPGSIVYFQLDRVMEGFDMYNDLKAVVEDKVGKLSAEVTKRQKKLEKDFSDLNEKIQKGLVTRSSAEVQARKLEERRQEFETFASQKQNESLEEQQVMMNQVLDAVKTFIEAFNEEHGFAMILANQGGAPILTGDSGLDITDAVIAGLNEEYAKNKSSK